MYITQASRQKTISIITDVDRLDVRVEPGKSYDFVIVYNGKRCNQRLSSVPVNGPIYESKNQRSAASIPFVLGPDNAIHIKGIINQSESLDLIFDTGASIGVLSDIGQKKGVRIADGPDNTIDLSSARIRNGSMIFIDYKGKLHADGVVGYNLFFGKVVAIDYDQKVLTISDALPAMGIDYAKTQMIWRGAGTFVPITLNHGNDAEQTLALLIPGRNGLCP